jgi:hypothetical protein
MDAFEEIVASLFRRLGYWTWQNYKIDLEVIDKIEIGKHSMPRPEIDILAYQPRTNELLWIECKSFLNSQGVKITSAENNEQKKLIGIKVFDDDNFRTIATRKLITQTFDRGLILDTNPILKYYLVAGNIHRGSESAIQAYFDLKRDDPWILCDRKWVAKRLSKLADLSYENDVATMVVKLMQQTKD